MTATAHKIIAIDGPAASGKSSVARELARRLGFVYVNSGAMYRALTWHFLERGLTMDDTVPIEKLADETVIRCELRGRDSVMLIGDVDPELFLRQDRVNDNVSRVSSVPRVREIIVEHLRRYALTNDLVMEGRDIGSV
ncbi:MAG TPA: (d)CMP kinase, partial [Chthoniobacterales bacterium]